MRLKRTRGCYGANYLSFTRFVARPVLAGSGGRRGTRKISTTKTLTYVCSDVYSQLRCAGWPLRNGAFLKDFVFVPRPVDTGANSSISTKYIASLHGGVDVLRNNGVFQDATPKLNHAKGEPITSPFVDGPFPGSTTTVSRRCTDAADARR